MGNIEFLFVFIVHRTCIAYGWEICVVSGGNKKIEFSATLFPHQTVLPLCHSIPLFTCAMDDSERCWKSVCMKYKCIGFYERWKKLKTGFERLPRKEFFKCKPMCNWSSSEWKISAWKYGTYIFNGRSNVSQC